MTLNVANCERAQKRVWHVRYACCATNFRDNPHLRARKRPGRAREKTYKRSTQEPNNKSPPGRCNGDISSARKLYRALSLLLLASRLAGKGRVLLYYASCLLEFLCCCLRCWLNLKAARDPCAATMLAGGVDGHNCVRFSYPLSHL